MARLHVVRLTFILTLLIILGITCISGSSTTTINNQLSSQTTTQARNNRSSIAYKIGNSVANSFNSSFGTYFGGKNNIDPYNTSFTSNVTIGTSGIAIDNAGNIYVTGSTCSNSFPTTINAYSRTYSGMCDAFVSKFNKSGQLVYSTYLGGKGEDDGFGIAVDNNSNIYVTGVTCSNNFPVTTNSFQYNFAGGYYGQMCGDIFVSKFNDLGQLVYSTYLGGNGADFGTRIAVDSNENIYITGATSSTNFPITSNAFNKTFGGLQDAIVSEFNSTGQLVYSTYIGGSGVEAGWGIAVNPNTKNFVITGETCSNTFPTTQNAYNRTYGGDSQLNNSMCGDAFVSEFNTLGQLVYSTFVGGSNGDDATAIKINSNNGNMYITGFTNSTNFPLTSNAYDHVYNEACSNSFCGHAFVTELDGTGKMVYSTFLGGSRTDIGQDIAVDINTGNIYVIGATNSVDFPVTPDAYTHTYLGGSNDVFLSEFNSSGQLIYSTYLGGTGNDNGLGITISSLTANIYVSGTTNSVDLPITSNAYQSTNPDPIAGSGFILELCNVSNSSCTSGTNPINNTNPSSTQLPLTTTPGYEVLVFIGGCVFLTLVTTWKHKNKIE